MRKKLKTFDILEFPHLWGSQAVPAHRWHPQNRGQMRFSSTPWDSARTSATMATVATGDGKWRSGNLTTPNHQVPGPLDALGPKHVALGPTRDSTVTTPNEDLCCEDGMVTGHHEFLGSVELTLEAMLSIFCSVVLWWLYPGLGHQSLMGFHNGPSCLMGVPAKAPPSVRPRRLCTWKNRSRHMCPHMFIYFPYIFPLQAGKTHSFPVDFRWLPRLLFGLGRLGLRRLDHCEAHGTSGDEEDSAGGSTWQTQCHNLINHPHTPLFHGPLPHYHTNHR